MHRQRLGCRRTALALAACSCTLAAVGQTVPAAQQSIVVTATRIGTPSLDVPASIDSLDGAQIREGRLQVNMSESLAAVAGLQVRDRQNYAQDVQVSVRGFGARSTFGIRGVRLYVDGIPATLPDGQGQLSNVDFASVERMEVLRGPFSALYGNSSGGVIQVFTEDGKGRPALSASLAAGSDRAARAGVKLTGAQGAFGYVASASTFETDGYRQHSAAQRRLGNLKLSWTPDSATRLSLIANSVSLPLAQDPLGLTRAQFNADPRSVDPVAEAFNTRKTMDQTQFGLQGERSFGSAGRLQLLVYRGERSTEQFQAIPTGPQASPLHPGGVIQLQREYHGADARWTVGAIAGVPLSLVAGVSYDVLDEHRVGRQNFVGTTLGVEGALRRDEENRVRSFDQYLQLGWQPHAALSLNAGVRRSSVRFASRDHYVVGPNPDDSGAVRYSATLPVLGVLYTLGSGWRVYATAGRGFETPTLNELAYRSDGVTGLNLGLQAARSDNAEIGVKLATSSWGNLRLAVFGVRTQHEIVTQSNVGGRSTFTNAGSTSRRGWEASWSTVLANDLELRAAYTHLNAFYGDAFATCVATPCAAANFTIPAGNKIPGLSRSSAYAALAWLPSQGWRGGAELRGSSRVLVNDANTDSAPGYTTLAAHVGYAMKLGPGEVSAFARADNIFDRRYAGSVIVNEGNQRYFEPAPGRTWLVGVSGSLAF